MSWSAPNQQVVREDQSGPGIGDNPDTQPQPAEQPAPSNPLDAMTKDGLLAYAADHDIEGVDSSMTKADIRAAIGS